MKSKKTNNSSEKITSMEELLAKYGNKVKGFSRSQKVEAKLLDIGKKSATFDIGGKSAAMLVDIYFDEARDFVKSLKIGDTVTATVIDPETREGYTLISLRHAANDLFWENLEEAQKEGKEVSVVGKSVSGKGLTAELDSLTVFIPSTQIGKKTAQNLESLVGKRFVAKVLEVDKSRRRVLLSEKAVSEKGAIELYKKAVAAVKEGEIYEGEVTQVTNFGAFVEIKVTLPGKTKKTVPVEGLVHVSELSWNKTSTPEELLAEGDKTSVKALGLHDGKLALSLKQAEADPWEQVAKKYKADVKLTGKVVKTSDFGVFVEIEHGVEGLIHITKIPPATKLSVGDTVNCYVEEVDMANKKISLGLVLTSKPVGYK